MKPFYEETGVPAIYAPIFALRTSAHRALIIEPWPRLLAELLVKLGEENRQGGRHAQAIFYYEAAGHLGGVMLREADSLRDGLDATAIIAVVSGPFIISESERRAIESLPISVGEKHERIREARGRNFRAYLVAHGRPDLAQAYARDSAHARRSRADTRKASRNSFAQMQALASRKFLRVLVAWFHASCVLTLLLVVGLLSFVLRWWKEKQPGPPWRWWEWAALVIVAFVLAHLVTFLIYARVPEVERLEIFEPAFYLGLASAAPLLIVVPIVGGLLKRRRQPPEARLGRARACLASFRTLLLPTFAVLLAVALALSIPAETTLQKWAAEQKKIVQQGEVKYWRIGVPQH